MPAQADDECVVEFHNRRPREARFEVVFRWGELPPTTRVEIAFEQLPDARPAVHARAEDLRRYGIVLLRPREPRLPATRQDRRGGLRHFDVARLYTLSAARDTVIREVRIPGGRSLAIAIHLVFPEGTPADALRFKVIQQAAGEPVDGITCVVRPQRRAERPTA